MGMENRYDTYKDSGIAWIGEIPEHWEIKRLKNVSDFNPQNDQSISNFSEVGYLPMERLKNGYMLPSVIDIYNLTQGLTFFKENDIVMAKVTPCFENGNIAIAKNLINNCGFGSSELFIFRARNINKKYFFYLLQEEKIKEVCKSTMIGTGGLKRISPIFMRNILLPIPTTLEQQSIATYLDQKCSEIDELITLQEEMITKLQSYKQSVITEAVTKGLDKNVPLKDSGIEWIGEIPEHWNIYQLKRCSKFINGYAFNSNHFNKDKGIPVIRIGDIKYEQISFENIVYVQENYELEKFIVHKNDILIAMSGATVGKIGIYSSDDKVYINQRVGIIRATQYNYIKRMFSTNGFIDYINLSSAGSAQPNISSDGILNFNIPVPPINEQQSIATYLDQKCSEIDELISIKQQKIEKLKDYKKSLIFECVTGKRKV